MASFYPAKCIQLSELVLNKAMTFGKGTTDWVQKHGYGSIYREGIYIVGFF